MREEGRGEEGGREREVAGGEGGGSACRGGGGRKDRLPDRGCASPMKSIGVRKILIRDGGGSPQGYSRSLRSKKSEGAKGERRARVGDRCCDIRGRGNGPWDRADAGPGVRVVFLSSKTACATRENAIWAVKSR